MGMGDKPKPSPPSYAPVRCDVSGKSFAPGTVRHCPEPHVVAQYGLSGTANVCWYVCNTCKYAIREGLFGGITCGYGDR